MNIVRFIIPWISILYPYLIICFVLLFIDMLSFPLDIYEVEVTFLGIRVDIC